MVTRAPTGSRRTRGALSAHLAKGSPHSPRAVSIVLALTAAAVLAGLIIQMIAQHVAGAQ
jgi:hypothetical protein